MADYNVTKETSEGPKKLGPEQVKKLEEARKKQLELIKKVKEKLDKMKKDLEPFKKEAVSKYKNEIQGMLLAPPNKKGGTIDVLALLNVEGKTPKEQHEQRLKVEKGLNDLIKKSVKGIAVRTLLLEELWDMCYKGKYDILSMVALGMPLYDMGILGALRVAELHKNMVLKKFEKYVVSYIISGSFLYGRAKPTSDLDAFIVIDDTDVTRMTSQELRTKLRGIIMGMVAEASMATGVKGKLHVQVWVLTDMWDSIKNVNPIMFNVLRDGVPLYDRGMFMPWKLLLKKGKLTPTPEAVDSYLKTGEQAMKRVGFKLREIAELDMFYAVVTPSQGILMMIGVPPPVHVDTANALREHFVKPGLLEEEYAKTVEDVVKLHKDLEHGKLKEVSAKDVEQLSKRVEKFLKRFDKLAKQVENIRVKSEVKDLYEKAMEDVSAALKMAGVSPGKDLLKTFEKEVVSAKLAPSRYLEVLKKIKDLKDKPEGSRVEISRLMFEQDRLAKDVFDIIRAQKIGAIERYKTSGLYGDKRADVWLLGREVYIVKDVTTPQTGIYKYGVGSKGELKDEKKVTLKELNDAVKKYAGEATAVTDSTLKSLKDILGNDLKLMVA